MAWTAPRTWTTGELVTAAIMNTHVRDNQLQTAVAIATTAGQIPYASAANTLAMLNAVAAGSVLASNGTAAAPVWTTTPRINGNSALYATTYTAAFDNAFGYTRNWTVMVDSGNAGSQDAGLSLVGRRTVDARFAAISFYNSASGSGAPNHMAQIYASRNGADNTALLTIAMMSAGSLADRVYVGPTGDVGIGVVAAVGKLDVNGNIYVPNNSDIRTKTNGGTARQLLYASTSDFVTIGDSASWAGINFLPGRALAWQMNSSGHLLTGTDNSFDIGASGATRPRNVYVGTLLTVQSATLDNTGLSFASSAVLNGAGGTSVILKIGGTSYTVLTSTYFSAVTDNQLALGQDTSHRWTAVYAVNGTIQTSHSDAKNFLGKVDVAEALAVARQTARGGGFHRFTYKGDHEHKHLLHYRHVGIKAEHAHEWLSPDGETVNPQTTASVALAAVAGEADAREADVAALTARLDAAERLIEQLRNRRN